MALKVQIATVSMPQREKDVRRNRKRELGVSKVISPLQHNRSVKHS